jgi:hypothetical protein
MATGFEVANWEASAAAFRLPPWQISATNRTALKASEHRTGNTQAAQ